MMQRVHDAESVQEKNAAVPVVLPLLPDYGYAGGLARARGAFPLSPQRSMILSAIKSGVTMDQQYLEALARSAGLEKALAEFPDDVAGAAAHPRGTHARSVSVGWVFALAGVVVVVGPSPPLYVSWP